MSPAAAELAPRSQRLAELHARVAWRAVWHTVRADKRLLLAAIVVAVGAIQLARLPGRSVAAIFGISALGIAQAAVFTRLRADRDWMRLLDADRRWLLAMESALVALPFALLTFATGPPMAPMAALVALVGGLLAGFLRPARPSHDRARARVWIPFHRLAPEWVAGLRQSPAAAALWLAMSVFAAWHPWIAGAALVAAGMYATQFFAVGEPRAWLQAARLSPTRVLGQKIGVAAVIFLLLAAIPSLAIAVGPARSLTALGLVLIAALGGWIVVVVALLAKYAFYEEGLVFSRLLALVASLTVLSFLFPPMTALGVAHLWRRARRRLDEVV